MPKFYFHVIDGKILVDGEGTELPDIDTARRQAVAIASSLLKGSLTAWPSEHGWQVVIADASRTVLATLAFGVKMPAKPDVQAIH